MSAQRSHETHVDKRFIKDKRHACRSYGRTPTPTMENTSSRAHKACVTSAYTNTTRMIEDQRLVTSVTQCGQRNVAKGPLSPRLPAPFRLKSSAAEVQQASFHRGSLPLSGSSLELLKFSRPHRIEKSLSSGPSREQACLAGWTDRDGRKHRRTDREQGDDRRAQYASIKATHEDRCYLGNKAAYIDVLNSSRLQATPLSVLKSATSTNAPDHARFTHAHV